MPPKSSTTKKPRTKANSEGIETAVVSEKPEGYVFGRPTAYRPEYAQEAKDLYDKGFTDEEVADAFAVSVRTLYRWQVDFPDFCHATKMGKSSPDDRTERSLYHRANGFEWYEEQAIKVKEVTWEDGKKVETERIEVVKLLRRAPPDTTACIFWLKNRRKEDWRDKHEVDHNHRIIIEMTDDELADIAAGRSPRTASTQGNSQRPH